jgi:hypothetical protein
MNVCLVCKNRLGLHLAELISLLRPRWKAAVSIEINQRKLIGGNFGT